MKKFLLMGIAVFACLVSVCGCDNKEKDKDVKDKPSYSMGPFELKTGDLEDREINESIKLSNTKFSVTDNKTTYSTEITNTSDKEVQIYELHIIIKNKNGTELIKFIARVDNLQAGETKGLETSMDYKLQGYSTAEYEIIKSAPVTE